MDPKASPARGRRRGPGPFRLLGTLAAFTDELVLAGLALFLFVVAANTQTGWLYVVVSLIAGLLVLSWLLTRATLRDLQVVRPAEVRLGQGEPARLELEVRNPSARERWMVALEERLPETLPGPGRARIFLIDRIPARGSVRVSYEVEATLRGHHLLPPVRLRTRAPLGFFPAERTVPAPGRLVIYPRGPRLRANPLRNVMPRRSVRQRTFARAGSSEDLQGLRPYTPGEDIRYIHWAATARTGELIVREFRESGSQGLAILLDNGPGSQVGRLPDTPLERAVAAATSLTEYAHHSGLPLVILRQKEGRLAALRNPRLEEALDLLAGVQPEGEWEWRHLLGEAVDLVPPGSHLFLLACRPLLDLHLLEPLRARQVRLSAVLFPAARYAAAAGVAFQGPGEEEFRRSLSLLQEAGVVATLHGPGDDLLESLQPGPEARRGGRR
jgi:uncharacterized protein (DUF58 family)